MGREAEQRHNESLKKAFVKLEQESMELVRREKAKVLNLQQQLSSLESPMGEYQRGKTSDSKLRQSDFDSEQLLRITALEADLASALGDDWSDDVDQEQPSLVHTQKSACHWSAISKDSTATS